MTPRSMLSGGIRNGSGASPVTWSGKDPLSPLEVAKPPSRCTVVRNRNTPATKSENMIAEDAVLGSIATLTEMRSPSEKCRCGI
jgi:hypothetical protein